MRILIDVTDARFAFVLSPIAAHKYVEGDATVSRTYSALTLEQLQRLYRNTTGRELPARDYSAVLQACKFLAIRLLTDDKGGLQNGYSLEKDAGTEADASQADEATR